MIRETFYKDRPAIELSCDKFSVLFLPLDGAKIASFKTDTGDELLAQTAGEKYLHLDLEGDYEKSECSGFDDMFPTIDPCEIKGLQYLDHGQVCRHEHRVEIEEDKVIFSCDLPTLNICFQKTAWCEDGALWVQYEIENHNDYDFPYLWAAHMLMKGEEGAYAVSNLPPDIKLVDGKANKETAHILPPIGGKSYKFYHTGETHPLHCGIVYPKSKREVTVEFDNAVVKYFGVWVNPGEINGMYTLALEPCTALYDTPVNAEKASAASYIKTHNKVEFTMKMSYKNYKEQEK